MAIVCLIRYQIDPSSEALSRNTPRTGAASLPAAAVHLVGYFVPHEGTNDIAWGADRLRQPLVLRALQARLKPDKETRENVETAQTKRFILREERKFAEVVDGTFGIPAALAGPE